nr:MAG TPA: hypothetical protein [Bacteriophage sp.]
MLIWVHMQAAMCTPILCRRCTLIDMDLKA